MNLASSEHIQELCTAPSGWRLAEGRLLRQWIFADFAKAMQFVNLVAALAERRGHHPDIDIRYNRVELGLVTHDAGGITELDLQLARELSTLK